MDTTRQHLKRIQRAAAVRARRQAEFDAADETLRALIREGFDLKISGTALAEASGLSVPRVYQVRNGRR
jgi:hypothetical protein